MKKNEVLRPLGINQWAVICTIHQEPDYLFIGEEKKWAEEMKRKGLLVSKGKNRYGVTELGEARFDISNPK